MLADIETYSTVIRRVIVKRFHSIPAGVADTGPYSENVSITVGMQPAQYHADNAIGIGDTRPNVGLVQAFSERSNGTGRGSRYRANIGDNGNGLSSDCLQITL